MSSHKAVPAAGGAPSSGAAFTSGPAAAFGGGAFGAGANGPSQTPNPFQPAPFTAGSGGILGQQQSAPTGFGATATSTAGAVLSTTSAMCMSNSCFD